MDAYFIRTCELYILTSPATGFYSVGSMVINININARIKCSGGSSIEADKALPHPQLPRSNTLQYFYLQY